MHLLSHTTIFLSSKHPIQKYIKNTTCCLREHHVTHTNSNIWYMCVWYMSHFDICHVTYDRETHTHTHTHIKCFLCCNTWYVTYHEYIYHVLHDNVFLWYNTWYLTRNILQTKHLFITSVKQNKTLRLYSTRNVLFV